MNMPSSDKRSFLQGNSETVSGMNNNCFIIGSITAPGTGSSLWRNVKLAERGFQVSDFAIAIRFNHPLSEQLAAVAKVQIRALASVEPKDGVLAVKGLRNTYKPHLSKVENDAALLIHDSGEKNAAGQCFMQDKSNWINNLPKIVIGEWEVKTHGSKADFQLTTALKCADGKLRELAFFLNSSGMLFLNRSVGAEAFRRGDFNVIRFAFDTTNGEYAIWCNQMLIDNGKLAPRADRKAPFLTVGDGSGRVEGKAYMKYFRIGGAGTDADAPAVAPAKETIEPVAEVKAEFNKLIVTGLQSTYKPHLSKVENRTAHLLHNSPEKDDAYQVFSSRKSAFLSDPPEKVAGEFMVKIPASCGNTKCFQLTLALPCKQNSKVREMQFAVTATGVIFNNRSITNKDTFKKDQFNKIFFTLNTVDGKYTVFCNDKQIAAGTLKPRADRKAGFITAGDGSGGISGEAFLQYLKIGREK